MSDSFLDHLGGPEKERIVKRLRSPEAYEKLRETVKGPEDLERALDHAEKMAELHFALVSNREQHDALKSVVERTAQREGAEGVAEEGIDLSDEARAAIVDGRFRLEVSAHEETNDDALMIVPEGNVQEKVPVNVSLTNVCLSQLSQDA